MTPQLNGSSKIVMDDSDEHALAAFARKFHPIILGAIVGVIGSLIGSGFILKPATTASVEDLKTSLTAYIEKHDKIDSIREEFIKQSLQDIKTNLKEMADRATQRELQQVRMEARVEDVIRYLSLHSQATAPLPPAPAPGQLSPLSKGARGRPAIVTEPPSP